MASSQAVVEGDEGLPVSIEAAKVHDLRASGMGATDIAKALGIGRASVYRHLKV